MKRRDFISAGSGLALTALSPIGRAALPCPPPLFSASGSNTPTSCTNTAPAWFNSMSDKTWATPVSNTLDSVKPSANYGNHTAVCNAWTGGCVDQDRGELILAANGGHGDYAGNEVYACSLRSASPAWSRITNVTTANGGDDSMRSAMNYSDGLPRARHGYNRCVWGNGRVWYAGVDGVADSGYWSLACYSFNRSSLAWTYHGIPSNNTTGSYSWEGGPAAYDKVGNKVWSAAQFGLQDGGYSVDATTGALTKFNWVLSGNPFGYAWSVIAHDLRVWIVGSVNEARIWILNLDNTAAGWTQLSTSGSPNGFTSGGGAVYHQASRAILVWHHSYGASLRKLAIPSSPLSGTYTWSTVNPAAGNSVTPPGALDADFQGAFSKFNMIEDMGNGQSALCFVGRTTGQTYAYKVPASGV